MTAVPACGGSVEEVLARLTDPDFCADAQRTIAEAAAIAAEASSFEDWEPRAQQLGLKFAERWGVPPPTTSELVDQDPRRRFVDAIASGRWGIVLVWPWTRNIQIRANLKRIRSVIRKQHQDALMFRDAQLVRWLEAIGFDRPTIALAVFQRRTGLRRPTEEQAIRRTPVGRESQLFEEYLARGFTKTQAQQKLTKRLRGSEAPASAAVRMAAQRYVERVKSLNENLATPLQSEPVSHALTLLFRALPDEPATTVRQHAIVVRDALQSVSRQRVEAILVSHWGLVPVFPWTTDSEIRSAVKALRTMMRPQPQGGRDPVTAARPIPLEPFSDALISLLLTLTDPRDAGVGRSALALRTTFMPATAS